MSGAGFLWTVLKPGRLAKMREKRIIVLVMWKPRSKAGGARGSVPNPPLMVSEAVPRTRANTHAVCTLSKVHSHSVGQVAPLSIWQMRKLRHRKITCSRSHNLEMAGFELR